MIKETQCAFCDKELKDIPEVVTRNKQLETEIARLELNLRLADNERTDGHVAMECDCDNIGCMFCDGGLFACTVCGSFEGATTTDCPGRRIHLTDEVYAGRLDYRIINGVGSWVAGPSSDTPALWTLACERAGVRP